MHVHRRTTSTVIAVIVIASGFLLIPASADAHVKWFCGVLDLRAPPLGVRTVLSPMFATRAVGFLALVSGGTAADACLCRWWPSIATENGRTERLEEILIRLGIGGYALGLWNNMAVVPWGVGNDGAILTPELLTSDRFVGLIQLAVVMTVLFRRTCPLAGILVVALYGVGILRYGVFHMTDYVYFLGLAGYLILTGRPFDTRPTMRSRRVPLLAATLSFSLMWTAIEKFLYPGWTDIVLAVHPDITLGFPAPFVTLTAGFVEFSLAFYLLVGQGLLRLGALVFMLIFIAAIPEFGALDAVGHLPIIAIFLVVILHGTTGLQTTLRPMGTDAMRSARSVAVLYVGAMAALMVIYYGLQQTTWW